MGAPEGTEALGSDDEVRALLNEWLVDLPEGADGEEEIVNIGDAIVQ